MVDYKVEKLTSDTVTYLQRFEEDLDAFIINLSKQEDFKDIKVSKAIILGEAKDRNADSWQLKTNASFALTNSLLLQEKINAYLKTREKEINACIHAKHILIIDLLFEKKEKISDKEDSGDVPQDYYVPKEAKYKMENVILDESIKKEIEEAINIITYKSLIYDEWGFAEIDPYSKSVLNFYGPPGTGKTMTADAIAHRLGKTILAMNYAEIESKYVGDAAKNLMKAFESATKYDSVLFFDEADSFLGKRIQNVSQGADQALNSLRSQMLILLEKFNGIVIFATNLVSNFDTAFESRILKHIKFELPNLEARKRILKGLIPQRLPLAAPILDGEFTELGELTEGLSGRELKGAVLEVLLHKASEEGKNALFCYTDFKIGIEKKVESLRMLKEAKKSEKEKKILNALAKMPKEDLIKDTSIETEPKEN